MIDLLGFTGLALMLLAVSRDDIKQLRKIALAATSFFFVQALLLGSISLIVSNLCFISLYTFKLWKD